MVRVAGDPASWEAAEGVEAAAWLGAGVEAAGDPADVETVVVEAGAAEVDAAADVEGEAAVEVAGEPADLEAAASMSGTAGLEATSVLSSGTGGRMILPHTKPSGLIGLACLLQYCPRWPS